MLPICEWSENSSDIPLCANCHELFHIIDRGMTALSKDRNSKARSVSAWCAVIDRWGKDDLRLLCLYDLVNQSRRQRNQAHEETKRAACVFEILAEVNIND